MYILKSFFVMKRKANENKFFPVIFNLFCCHAVRYEYFDNSYFKNCTNIYIKIKQERAQLANGHL